MCFLFLVLCLYSAVFIHELGHLLIGGLCEITVTELAIGVGPSILSVKGKNMNFILGLLPLGGHTFFKPKQLSFLKKFLLNLSGVTFNFIAFIFLFYIYVDGNLTEGLIGLLSSIQNGTMLSYLQQLFIGKDNFNLKDFSIMLIASNFMFFISNLMPVPPLDGGEVVKDILEII